MSKKKIVVLTGAGISAESGLKTFRDSDGLWEGYNVMEVATPRGWKKDPAQVDRIFTLFPIIQEFLHRKGGMLSGGQQQQLAIGRFFHGAGSIINIFQHDHACGGTQMQIP